MWTKLQIATCLIDLEKQNPFLYEQLRKNPFSHIAKEQFRSWIRREDINPVLKVLYETEQHAEEQSYKQRFNA
jgi:hypothetical protein